MRLQPFLIAIFALSLVSCATSQSEPPARRFDADIVEVSCLEDEEGVRIVLSDQVGAHGAVGNLKQHSRLELDVPLRDGVHGESVRIGPDGPASGRFVVTGAPMIEQSDGRRRIERNRTDVEVTSGTVVLDGTDCAAGTASGLITAEIANAPTLEDAILVARFGPSPATAGVPTVR